MVAPPRAIEHVKGFVQLPEAELRPTTVRIRVREPLVSEVHQARGEALEAGGIGANSIGRNLSASSTCERIEEPMCVPTGAAGPGETRHKDLPREVAAVVRDVPKESHERHGRGPTFHLAPHDQHLPIEIRRPDQSHKAIVNAEFWVCLNDRQPLPEDLSVYRTAEQFDADSIDPSDPPAPVRSLQHVAPHIRCAERPCLVHASVIGYSLK